MKRKILSMFTLLAIVAGFSSCDDDYLRNETRDDVEWTTKKIKVEEEDWIYQSNRNAPGGYFYTDIKVNELDGDVFRGGLVCCYLYDGDDVQIPLPCTRTMSDGKHEWQRTIDFDFYRKGITIYVSDFPSDDFVPDPEEMKFRIALLY